MKLINEKGKLFGIINVIDLLVVVFILAVAGGVAWKIFGNQLEEITAPTTEITYKVRIRATYPSIYQAVVDKGFPQQLATSNGSVADSFLVNVESEPYVTQAITDNGQIVNATDPTKIDLVCTIKAKVNNAAVLKVGSQEVQLGKNHIVKTKYFEMSGAIETLELAETK